MKLSEMTPLLRRIARGESLSEAEARFTLNVLGVEDQVANTQVSDGFYLLALTFGIMAKGPSVEELYGFTLSLTDQSVRFDTAIPAERIIDVSGTGGDVIKTFNVGSTVAFVLAAGGLHVAKQSTRAYTGLTGSADVFQAVGVDPFMITADEVVRCLEEVGVVPFYTPAFSKAFANRIQFLTKLREIGLTFPTPWHLVSWVYSPFKMGSRLYGVFDERYVRPLAEVFGRLGYSRAMVVHGRGGLDEVSTMGSTVVAELRDRKVHEYELTPADMGLPVSSVEEVTRLAFETKDVATQLTDESVTSEPRQTAIELPYRILYGLERGAKRDLVLANSGAAFYVAGVTTTVADGVELARQHLETGAAARKVESLVQCAGDSELFANMRSAIGAR